MRKSVVSAVGALAAAGAVGVGVLVAAPSSGATVPVCYATNLRPSDGGQQGAAGHLWDTWRVTNVGSATCSLNGFPTVTNYRADGRPLATVVTHEDGHGTVTLAPGAHASFLLGYVQPGISGCTPQPAARMAFRTPGASNPLFVGRGEPSCYGQLEERALVAGG